MNNEKKPDVEKVPQQKPYLPDTERPLKPGQEVLLG